MDERLRKIVVGVDGSENARMALDWSCRLAERHQSDVEAIQAHAHPISPLVPALGASSVAVDQLVDPRRAQLHAIIDSIDTAVAVTETVVMRSAQFALEQASQTADLIVVGRTGRGRFENLLIGSTAGYCAHKSHCPVAVIGRAHPVGQVLVAVDGSDRSTQALAWSLQVWPTDEVLAVYSHDESILDELALDDAHRCQLASRAEDVLDAAITQACSDIDADPEAIRREVRAGDPRTTIVQSLATNELLVLGTQGHSGLAGWMLGSLADYAVHQAPGSVIVWRDKD